MVEQNIGQKRDRIAATQRCQLLNNKAKDRIFVRGTAGVAKIGCKRREGCIRWSKHSHVRGRLHSLHQTGRTKRLDQNVEVIRPCCDVDDVGKGGRYAACTQLVIGQSVAGHV